MGSSARTSEHPDSLRSDGPIRTSDPRRTSALWGDFEIRFDQELGRGGMGIVYRARQLSLDRPVAVKVLDPRNESEPEVLEAFLEKFRSEARALARLRDARIVQVIQAGHSDGRFWFAMELVEGETVDSRLSRDGAFAEPDARRVAADVARALDCAARSGIIHRDVKPGNIFLTPDGGVKVADWGLAKSAGEAPGKLTELHQLACTPSYAAPEQTLEQSPDFRADIYSLGCVLYEMLCECPPFECESPLELLFKHAHEPAPSPRTLNPSVSPELESIVLRCLAKNPADRFPSYADLIRELETPPAAQDPRVPRRFPLRNLVWVAAAAALSLASVALTLAFVDRSDIPAPAPDERPPQETIPAAQPEPSPAAEFIEPRHSIARSPDPSSPPPPFLPLPSDRSARWGPSSEQSTVHLFSTHAPTPEERSLLEPLLELSRAALSGRADDALRLIEGFPSSPWLDLFLEAERDRLRAGTASPDPARLLLPQLDLFPPHERVGLVDRAIEECLLAAGSGDFAPLLEFPETEESPLLRTRFELLRSETRAARLLRDGDLAELLSGDLSLRATRHAAADILRAFQAALRDERVGPMAFLEWVREGDVRFDHKTRRILLTASSWLMLPLADAVQGYEVRFRCLGEVATLRIAFSPRGWLDAGSRELAFSGRAKDSRRAELSPTEEPRILRLVPAFGRILVFVEDHLQWSLPLRDYPLEEGLKLGAVRLGVSIESVRVKDRN